MPGDYKTPNYTLYFDTNAAYSKKPSDSVSPKIISSLVSARKLTTVNVRVPEVVFEELIYQQFKIAQSAAENLQKNSKTIQEVCGNEVIQPPNSKEIESGIRTQFEELCSDNSIVKLATPYGEIDWKRVVSDSCWRRPPFEKPKSEDDLAEKGFRDRMILETTKLDVATIEDGVIAFISGDNLLRTTFKNHAQSKCPIEVYSGFPEFIGHLELLAKTKSEQHTEDVLAKVTSVFYDPENPDCVVLSKGVLEHLTKEYADEMARPSILQVGSPKYTQTSDTFSTFTQPLAATNIPAGEWMDEAKRWTPVTGLKIFASPPVFQPGAADDRYHWKSTVTLVRLLRRALPRLGQSYSLPVERIKTKDIDVLWSCVIDPNTAEFSDLSVEEYQPQFRESFVDADWQTRTAYDLPIIPGLDDTNG